MAFPSKGAMVRSVSANTILRTASSGTPASFSRMAASPTNGPEERAPQTQVLCRHPMNAIAALLVVLVTARSSLGGITIALPEGWRRLDAQESKILKPELKPQNKLQRRLAEHPDEAVPLIVMKHDVPGSIAASVQVFLNPIPAEMRFASSIELARVIAFTSVAPFRGKYELSPHETTVGG